MDRYEAVQTGNGLILRSAGLLFIAPQAYFLFVQKVGKDTVKEREFRFSLSFTILTLKTTNTGGDCGPPYWMYPPGIVGRTARQTTKLRGRRVG